MRPVQGMVACSAPPPRTSRPRLCALRGAARKGLAHLQRGHQQGHGIHRHQRAQQRLGQQGSEDHCSQLQGAGWTAPGRSWSSRDAAPVAPLTLPQCRQAADAPQPVVATHRAGCGHGHAEGHIGPGKVCDDVAGGAARAAAHDAQPAGGRQQLEGGASAAARRGCLQRMRASVLVPANKTRTLAASCHASSNMTASASQPWGARHAAGAVPRRPPRALTRW